jgi:hypothetical protein
MLNRTGTTVLNLAGASLALSVFASLVILTADTAHAANGADPAPVAAGRAPGAHAANVAVPRTIPARSTVRGPRVACVTEDALNVPCVWDARAMGNGRGHSFIVTRSHTRVYVSHARAHALLFGAGA